MLNKGMRVIEAGIHTIIAYALYATVAVRTSVRRYRASAPRSGRPSNSLLLVTWLFAPEVSGGIYRPAALCRYAHELKWDVTVVAGPAPDNPSQAGLQVLEYIPSTVRIIRAGGPRWQPSWRGFPRVDGGLLSAFTMVKAGWSAFQAEPPGVIVASGPPFANFIAGYYLARAWRVPLILDYRDEWTECPFEFVQKGSFNRRWEARCLKASTLVVFTTASMLEHQVNIFKHLDRSKCAVVPNGWEPGETRVQSRKVPDKAQSSRRIVLLYAGNLSEHTLPGPFLKAIASVISRTPALEERLQIVFLGQKSETALRQLSDFPFRRVLVLNDQVPKSVAAEMMQAASALLLINERRLDRYLPGKLFDYIASGTPILIYGAGGESAQLVSQLQAGQVIEEGDVQELEAFINGVAIQRPLTSGIPQIEDWLVRHTRQATSLTLLNLLDEIA
jgi:glycosyltransferase involved in cell wall biosynthesis